MNYKKIILAGFCAALLLQMPSAPLRGQELIPIAIDNIYGINNSGQVVGESYVPADETDEAFIDSPTSGGNYGTPVNLGNLGSDYSGATGINNSGQVVGGSDNSGGSGEAFVVSPDSGGNYGALVGLGVPPGAGQSGAAAINDSGQVVGTGSSPGNFQAFIVSPSSGGNYGTPVGLGTLNGSTFSQANGINKSGQVVGTSVNGGGNANEAFVVSPDGSGNYGSLVGLGTLNGYTDSAATGINNSGQIIGYASTSGGSEAFIVSPDVHGNYGSLTGLVNVGGSSYSYANGINSSGEVVGYFLNAFDTEEAFLYTPATGVETDLNTLEAPLLVVQGGTQSGFYNLDDATVINDSGEIAGVGTYYNYNTDSSYFESFLLEVPEPPTWALGLISLSALFLLRRRALRA